MNLIKSTGKLRKDMGEELRKPRVEVKDCETESDMRTDKAEQ